ncbi:MAG: preprotein translocase subunit YajC [Coriobacteriia bacterium]|jgi:preprotein translocase subunit YajC|nr:preprotein translocase subunit YajC [Coriobacteriia bacterium]
MQGLQGSGGLIYLGVLVVAFYLLIIRPQMQRSKQVRELMASLAVGDEIITIGGLHGTVSAIEGALVTVRVAGDTELVFEKSAIGRRSAKPEQVTDNAEPAETGEASKSSDSDSE